MHEEITGPVENGYELSMEVYSPSTIRRTVDIRAMSDVRTPETVEELTSIIEGNANLWLKKAAISALWRMKYLPIKGDRINEISGRGVSDRLIRQMPGTNEYYRLTGGHMGESGEIVWFTETPQLYPDISHVTTVNPQVEFIEGTGLMFETPRWLLDRIRSDIAWMIEHQCAIGVSQRDLMHVHILFRTREWSDVRGTMAFDNRELEETEIQLHHLTEKTQKKLSLNNMRSFPDKEQMSQILDRQLAFIRKLQEEMVLLYHTLEHELRLYLHPFYVNRNILTFPGGKRLVAIGVSDSHTVHAETLEGINEATLRAKLRIGKEGKNDQDLSGLEVIMTPF